jgi:DNA-binding PadR family transcriptional regulator
VQLHEELILQGHGISYESLYDVLKKMTRRNLLQMQRQARPDGSGKGINLWRIVDK